MTAVTTSPKMSQEGLDDLDAVSRSFWSQISFAHLADPEYQLAAEAAAAQPNWQDLAGNPDAMASMAEEKFIAVEEVDERITKAVKALVGATSE